MEENMNIQPGDEDLTIDVLAIEPEPEPEPVELPERRWEQDLKISDLTLEEFNTKTKIGSISENNTEAIEKLKEAISNGKATSAVYNNLGCAYCFEAYSFELDSEKELAAKRYMQAKFYFNKGISLGTTNGNLDDEAKKAKDNLGKLKENGVI
jgi:hypothetical protein